MQLSTPSDAAIYILGCYSCGALISYNRENSLPAYILNKIGVITHELMHFIVGLILLAKPSDVDLIARIKNKTEIQGSVTFRNVTLWNAMPIAIAPLISAGIIYEYFAKMSILDLAAAFPIASSIVFNSIPSAMDLRIAIYSWPIIAAALIISYWLL